MSLWLAGTADVFFMALSSRGLRYIYTVGVLKVMLKIQN